MTGQAWISENGNPSYDARIDIPLANKTLFLVTSTAVRASVAPVVVVARVVTDSEGRFWIRFKPRTPGETLSIIHGKLSNAPIYSVKVNAKGGLNSPLLIAIKRPAPPVTVLPPAISNNTATLTGTGLSNAIVELEINSTVSNRTVASPAFSFVSPYLHSGETFFRLRQTDARGIESPWISGGSSTILPPPVVLNCTWLLSVKCVLYGEAVPLVRVDIWVNGTAFAGFVHYGWTPALSDGTFKIPLAFPPGPVTVTATQVDAAGYSDPALVGDFVIRLP